MDPLSSLSVASSAIQIFEFSSKLWKEIRELHRSQNGTTRKQETILADAARLRSLNSGLCELLKPVNLKRSPTTTEESVVSLCNECGDAAKELVDAIQKLTLEERSDVSGLRNRCPDNLHPRLTREGSDRGMDRFRLTFEEAEGHRSTWRSEIQAADTRRKARRCMGCD